MTLVFSGNDYKYELEGIMKLFIPARLFKHVYSDKCEAEGDFVFARKKEFSSYTLLYVIVSYEGKTAHKAHIVPGGSSGYEADCELIMSRLLYKVMQRLTGKGSGWGVITGIRPVKRVNTMLSEGLRAKEIFTVMKERYLCSDEKCRIAYMTAKVQEQALKELSSDSFSLYISIPFCPTRCSYCSFVSQSVEGTAKLIPEYINKLCEEIRYTGTLVKKLGFKLDTVYFGGGTPTTLTAQQLGRIIDTVSDSFDMSHLREYTVEAGRPDTITPDKLEILKQKGVGRISINPQTLNDEVLEAIGRKHTVRQFYDSFALAKQAGFECINTDIIAGLPKD
ncbi:MAG: coproporphyrinogen dehydrogenase HemZ, partial [Ruminococcus sp.]|nr:coproporphyrinogen dehydrogenase HemZ [Ruminococcus sp.]